MATTMSSTDGSSSSTTPPLPPTNLVGIIIPPPARKVVIDKTAGFAAQYGRQIEEPLLSRPTEKNAADFMFLLETNEFHAYYLNKIKELQEAAAAGKNKPAVEPKDETTTPVEAAKPIDEHQQSSAVVVATRVKDAPSGLLSWLTKYDAIPFDKKSTSSLTNFKYLNSSQTNPDFFTKRWSLMALTARYVVASGTKFESELTHQAKTDPQLEFMLPDRPYHSDYLDLISEYKNLLSLCSSSSDSTPDLDDTKRAIMNRVVEQYDFERREKLKDPEREEIETIDFDDDEDDKNVSMKEKSEQEPQVDQSLIRKDYTVQGKKAVVSTPMITLQDGRSVPASEASKHLKAELQDPKWREQQDRFEAKQRETNMVTGAALVQNLAKLVRPEDSTSLSEKKVIWDGSVFSADAVKQQQQQQRGGFSDPQQQQQQTKRVKVEQQHNPPPYYPPPPTAGYHHQPPPLPPYAQVPPPSMMMMPPPSYPPQPQASSSSQFPIQEQQYTLQVLAPTNGAPPALLGRLPETLSIRLTSRETSMGVQQIKEKISENLDNVPLSKFQLVLGGRFLKNTDNVSLPLRESMEIKWKTK